MDKIDLTSSSSMADIIKFTPKANGAARQSMPSEHEARTEIERLAGLPTLKYQMERKAAATLLGISATVLDGLVKDQRKENGDTKGQGRPLSLPEPEPWEEHINGSDLMLNLIKAIRRYMVMDDNEVIATALWILHCHVVDAFTISPRLAITSPEKGCGKTTLLDILNVLVPRPLPAANTKSASIFRSIEIAHPTLLIDEADTFLREDDELRGILNSGHRKGGVVLRTVGEDHEPRQFSTWSPVAIAMIGRLPETLEDRSIPIRLRRKRDGETVGMFRIDRVDELGRLARMAARWGQDNVDALSADPVMPPNLYNRAQDNWRPLVAIADQIGGEWPDRVRLVAEGVAASASGNDQSIGAMLLADIREAFESEGVDRLSSDALVTFLGAKDDRPWPEWGKSNKPMTKAALARQLSKFGINTDQIRFGERTVKGYHLHRFEDAFSRYTPFQNETPKQPNKNGGFSHFQNETPETPVSVSKSEKPLRHSDCFDVSVCEPPSEENGASGSATEVIGDGQPACAQCGGGPSTSPPADPPKAMIIGGKSVLLHPECKRFWGG